MFSKVPKSMIGNKKKTSSGFGSGGSGASEGGSEGDSNTETTQESGKSELQIGLRICTVELQ